MQTDLTKQYAGLFEKKGFKRIFALIRDIYRSGKLREMVSFAVWELQHLLHLFPKKSYIRLNTRDGLSLEPLDISAPDFDQKVNQLLGASGARAERCLHNWKLIFHHGEVIYGVVYPDDDQLLVSADGGNTLRFLAKFPEQIKSIYVSARGAILVNVKGAMFHSVDQGKSFRKVLDLGSPESFIRFNNAYTETPDGILILGEYGNIWDPGGWRNLANLYYSQDNGATWETSEFLKTRGTNKHVHLVHYSTYLKKVVMACGDNHKRLWISEPAGHFQYEKPGWQVVNRFHIQMGGYTSVVEVGGKILFGTDYQGGTNFLVETVDGKKFVKKVMPDPYRRSPIDNMIVRRTRQGVEIWANLPYSTSGTKSLLMVSRDGGETWSKVFDYHRSHHTVWITSSSTTIRDVIYFSVEDNRTNERIVYRITDHS